LKAKKIFKILNPAVESKIVFTKKLLKIVNPAVERKEVAKKILNQRLLSKKY